LRTERGLSQGQAAGFRVVFGELGVAISGFLRKTDPGSRTHSLVIKRLDE
jgi:hypothetical protein